MFKEEFKDFIIEEVDPADKAALTSIGALRYRVWEEEVDAQMFPDKIWIDPYDTESRHWIVYLKNDPEKKLVAAARLTVHNTLEASVDGFAWIANGLTVPAPVSNISKLVVDTNYRRFGIASFLNEHRIREAKAMGVKSITATSSKINTDILVSKYGFRDTGKTVIFPNRPTVIFNLVELVVF